MSKSVTTETGMFIFLSSLRKNIFAKCKYAVEPTFTIDTSCLVKLYPKHSAIAGINISSAQPSTIITPFAKKRFDFCCFKKRDRKRG